MVGWWLAPSRGLAIPDGLSLGWVDGSVGAEADTDGFLPSATCCLSSSLPRTRKPVTPHGDDHGGRGDDRHERRLLLLPAVGTAGHARAGDRVLLGHGRLLVRVRLAVTRLLAVSLLWVAGLRGRLLPVAGLRGLLRIAGLCRRLLRVPGLGRRLLIRVRLLVPRLLVGVLTLVLRVLLAPGRLLSWPHGQ